MANFLFFKQFLKLRNEIGAFFPSSEIIGKKITKYINHEIKKPIRVLEVGPGTGSITEFIIKKMDKDDELILVEMNSDFCALLTRKSIEWKKKGHSPKITIKEMSIFDFQDTQKFDFIICALPINNFPVEFVENLMNLFSKLISLDGIFSYYEYKFFRTWGKTIAPLKSIRTRMKELSHFFDSRLFRNKLSTDHVWKNLPPADIHHLKLN